MDKPLYSLRHLLYGGKLSEIPEPHIRMFPNDAGRKREVEIGVHTWVGYAYGATHFYVRVREESNPLWNSEDTLWQGAFDDEDYEGNAKGWDEVSLSAAIRRLREEAAKYDPSEWSISFGIALDDNLDEYVASLRKKYGVVDKRRYQSGD